MSPIDDQTGAPGVVAAGVDLVDVARFELALRRCGDALLHRVLSDAERDWVAGTEDPVREAAALFGVKEAVVKVAGGMPTGGRFRHIDVSPLDEDHPTVALDGAFAPWARRGGVRLLAGSRPLSDQLALSYVVAVAGDADPEELL